MKFLQDENSRRVACVVNYVCSGKFKIKGVETNQTLARKGCAELRAPGDCQFRFINHRPIRYIACILPVVHGLTLQLYLNIKVRWQTRPRDSDAINFITQYVSKHLYNIYTMSAQRQRRWDDVV